MTTIGEIESEMTMRQARRGSTTAARAGWVAIALLTIGFPAAAQFTPTEQTEMVNGHKAVREAANPIAMPMLGNQTWSSTLATSAQSWANQCNWMHSGTPGTGENLYASTGDPNTRPTPAEVVLNWSSEQSLYTYSTNGCSGTCGHYTQMVWRPATQVGCGIALCGSNTNPFPPPFNIYPWYIVVCQYNSIQSGARPYLCDYDGNGSTTELCTLAFFADGFEQVQTLPGRWEGKTP